MELVGLAICIIIYIASRYCEWRCMERARTRNAMRMHPSGFAYEYKMFYIHLNQIKDEYTGLCNKMSPVEATHKLIDNHSLILEKYKGHKLSDIFNAYAVICSREDCIRDNIWPMCVYERITGMVIEVPVDVDIAPLYITPEVCPTSYNEDRYQSLLRDDMNNKRRAIKERRAHHCWSGRFETYDEYIHIIGGYTK